MQAERRKLSRHSPVAKAMDYMLRRRDLCKPPGWAAFSD